MMMIIMMMTVRIIIVIIQKVNFTLEQAMKVQNGSRSIAVFFL